MFIVAPDRGENGQDQGNAERNGPADTSILLGRVSRTPDPPMRIHYQSSNMLIAIPGNYGLCILTAFVRSMEVHHWLDSRSNM